MSRLAATAALLLVATMAAASAAATPPRLAGCVPGSPSTVRPKKIIVACGDANFYFTKLVWSSWNAKNAVAAGTATMNDCKPYCAAGHFHTYKATVTLSRAKSCSDGQREFTRMAWRFVSATPAGMRRTGGQSLPCR
ncbi:MAG TPA: hypothetical protein VH538_04145 [Gaiellaceae bacterium]